MRLLEFDVKENTIECSMPLGRAGGDWIPLLEYAVKRGVSLSTLRRHIKAEKIEYRLVNGKYLVWCDENGGLQPPPIARSNGVVLERKTPLPESANKEEAHRLQSKLQRLELDLNKAQEEIAELKMLIALYEERIPSKKLGN